MASLSHINGIALASVSAVNGVSKASIEDINGVTVGTPSSITVKYQGTATAINDDVDRQNWYDDVTIAGRQTGDIFTMNVSHTATFTNNISSITLYWRKNGGTWVQFHNYTSSGSGTDQLAGIDDNDTVDIRIDIQTSGLDPQGTSTVTLTGGTITTGTGTVTAISPTQFTVSISP